MSRVVVVTTGGTIASIADDNGVLRPARTGAELLGDTYRNDVEVVDVTAKDSSQLTRRGLGRDHGGDHSGGRARTPTVSSSPTGPTRWRRPRCGWT